MNASDLAANAKNLTDAQFERRLNELVQKNYRYQNLDADNRRLVMDITKKYRTYLRKGYGITSTMIQREIISLKKAKPVSGLSDEDIKDIKEILQNLKP